MDELRNLLLNAVARSELIPEWRRARVLRWCGVDIPDDCRIIGAQNFRPGPVRFGHRVTMNRGCYFDPGPAFIDIGDDVGMAANVLIVAAHHDIGPSHHRATPATGRPVVIGRGSWLGANVVVLPGVTIGQGCVIGAGSVVTKSTEPDGLYLGVPARRIRDLDPHGEPPSLPPASRDIAAPTRSTGRRAVAERLADVRARNHSESPASADADSVAVRMANPREAAHPGTVAEN